MIYEFCGKELPRKDAFGISVPVPCTCEGAVRERERLDLEERRENWRETCAAAIRQANIPSDYGAYRKWGDGESLYLYGEQGRGKTEMACGALRKWIMDGIEPFTDERGRDTKRFYAKNSGKYVLMPKWVMEVKASFSSNLTTEDDLVSRLAGVGMLVMDDLGKGKMTDWVVEKIYLILELRTQEMKTKNLRTIITTQYPIEQLTSIFEGVTDKKMASAIRSRIEGMCEKKFVGGPDRRVAGVVQ